MQQQNIVLDFTVTKSVDSLLAKQELALMPADIAKMALMALAEKLQYSKGREIMKEFIKQLESVEDAVDKGEMVALQWVQERALIANVLQQNWDAYKVEHIIG